jgi:hypothetical protein
MSTRRPILAVAMTMSLALLVACENKVTQAGYDQIQTGMSLSQVEKILGGAGKDDTSHAGISISGAGVGSAAGSPEKTYVWSGKTMTIQVIVKDGKVVSKSKITN